MHSRRQGCQSLAVASRVLHASCTSIPLCRMNVVRFLDKVFMWSRIEGYHVWGYEGATLPGNIFRRGSQAPLPGRPQEVPLYQHRANLAQLWPT